MGPSRPYRKQRFTNGTEEDDFGAEITVVFAFMVEMCKAGGN